MKCSICGKSFKGYGNNPYPFIGDYCCDECNGKLVVPMRILLNSKTSAVLITPREIKAVKPKGRYFELKELQDLVGGYIELAQRAVDGFITIVNEEGLIKGLELNEVFLKMFDGSKYVGNVLLVPDDIFEAPDDEE